MYLYSCYSYSYPIGKITVACSETGIVGLWFCGQKYYMDILAGKAYEEKETNILRFAKHWLDRYFRGEKPAAWELPIEFTGSDFRKAVWQLLTQIPYGQVTTYGELAKQLAKQRGLPAMSAQAVGAAVGRNPISIIVPCHRVVGANGDLTGYAGGLEIKEKLLDLEGADLSRLNHKEKAAADLSGQLC